MELQTGRKLAAHMGSFGQTLSSKWAKHMGVLKDDDFLTQIGEGRKQVRKAMGAARVATSMARTKAGYKHKGGDTQADERFRQQDERFRQQAELIADQQNQIEELQKPAEEIAPVELNGAVDEADFAGLE